MSRYKYTKLRNLGPVNGFLIHTPDDRKLKDTNPQTIVRELNRLANRINQLETENGVANDMFKKLNIHALNLAARIKGLEEAGDKLHWAWMNPFDPAGETMVDNWIKAKEVKL